MKKIIMSLAAITAMSSTVTAGGPVAPVEAIVVPWTGFYVGGALTANQTYLDGEMDWFSTSVNNKTSYGLQGDLGYTFFNNGDIALSAEGRFGGSFGGDDFVETSYWGIYAKPEVIFDNVSVYGLLGYGELDYTKSGDLYNGSPVTYAYTTSTDGFSWGIGASYGITENVSAFIDYTALPELNVIGLDSVDGGVIVNDQYVYTDVISVGVNYRF